MDRNYRGDGIDAGRNGAGGNEDQDAYGNPNRDSHRNADDQRHSDHFCHSYGNRYSHGDRNDFRDPHGYSDVDSHADHIGNTHCDGYLDSNANCNRHFNGNEYPDGDPHARQLAVAATQQLRVYAWSLPMKRLLLIPLAVLLGCTQVNMPGPFGTTGKDDSDTANSLTAINPSSGSYGSSSYPGQLYFFLADEDANRWSEQGFTNSVSVAANANSCLGATSAGLTMTPTSCVAYNAGFRGTETGSITFSDASTTWVAMDENTSGNNAGLPNFTRVSGTHYLVDSIDVTQPTMASDSQLLMEVVTSAGAITGVTDFRTTNPVASVPGTGTVSSGTGPAIAQYHSGTTTNVVPSTMSGDCTIAQGGAMTCTKTSGVPFAPSATTDTTNATNIVAGTLNNSRLPTTITVAHLVGSTDVTASGLTPGRCVQAGTGGILTDASTACASSAGIPQGGPLTQALAAGSYKITGLGTNVSSGDALSQGQSHLNDLANATGNYDNGGFVLQNLGAPVTSGDALSFGHEAEVTGLSVDTGALPTTAGNFLLGGSPAGFDTACSGASVGCLATVGGAFYLSPPSFLNTFNFYSSDKTTEVFRIYGSANNPASAKYGFYAGQVTGPLVTGGTGGFYGANEGTASSASSNVDIIYADSTLHTWKTSLNNGSYVNLVRSGMMGSANATLSASAAQYFPFSGPGAPESSNEGHVSTIAPWIATLKNMKCVLTDGTGTVTVAGGTNYVMALRQNLSTTAMTCTIGTAASACTDTTHTITTAIGDQLDYIATPSGTPTALVGKCSVEVDF